MVITIKRRRFLATLVASASLTAGCLDSSSLLSSCKLNHEVSKGIDTGYTGTNLSYSELSDKSQEVFKKTLESGEYSFSYDGDNAPPDFSYSDEVSIYIIGYQEMDYTMMTYSEEGCSVN